jgi:hypothetical protein
MKTFHSVVAVMALLFSFFSHSIAQNLEVHNFIGKQRSEVIAAYGNPVHTDNSNTSMICLFYKSPTMIFVADETSIYQAEITKDYTNESEARSELDDMIKKSIKNGFTSDTVSVNIIKLHKTGIQTDIQLLNLKDKFEIKLKAVRHD